MHSKAVYLAVLLLAACGGSDGGSVSAGASASSDTTDPAAQPTQTTSSNCKDGLAGTIVGGDLFVAEQGAVTLTFLGNSGLSQYLFWVLYDNVYGIPAIS